MVFRRDLFYLYVHVYCKVILVSGSSVLMIVVVDCNQIYVWMSNYSKDNQYIVIVNTVVVCTISQSEFFTSCELFRTGSLWFVNSK